MRRGSREFIIISPYTNSSGSWHCHRASVPGTNPQHQPEVQHYRLLDSRAPGIFYLINQGIGIWQVHGHSIREEQPGLEQLCRDRMIKLLFFQGERFHLRQTILLKPGYYYNNGGFLDLTTWSFGSQLTALREQELSNWPHQLSFCSCEYISNN